MRASHVAHRLCWCQLIRSTASTRILGAVLACVVTYICSGCGTSLDAEERPTLPATITTDDTEPADQDTILPASNEDDTELEAFLAKPVFCCNPLSYDFEVIDPALTDLAVQRHEWDFGDGRTGEGRVVEHTYAHAGAYKVQLIAHLTDGTALTESRTVNVGIVYDEPVLIDDDPIEPAEADEEPDVTGPPVEDDDTPDQTEPLVVAEAGSSHHVVAGALVELDGSASMATGDGPTTYWWVQASGPLVDLQQPDRAVATFTAPADLEVSLTLVFSLEVAQGGLFDSDFVTVQVDPVDPVTPEPLSISAGHDKEATSGESVELSGTVQEAGRADYTCAWSQVAGPAVTLTGTSTLTPSFTAPAVAEPTSLSFELTVVMGEDTAYDEVTVLVVPMGLTEREQVLVWLRELPPLPKVHYNWPYFNAFIEGDNDEELYEYTRIANVACVWGAWSSRAVVDKFMGICRTINEGDPDIPATLAFEFSPWHRVWPSDLPPTDFGPFHDEEVAFHQTRFNELLQYVEDNNAAHDTRVEVSAIIFDSEVFFVKQPEEPDAEEWNTAMDTKYNIMYDMSKEAFPEAKVYWWGRAINQLFTFRERGDAFTVAPYHTATPSRIASSYRRAVESADNHGVDDCSMWISLGSHYSVKDDGSLSWTFENNYDLIYSWQLGARLNDPTYIDLPQNRAPWHRSHSVIMWPGPWDDRVPQWPLHFVAYIRGAHGIDELPAFD